MEGVEDVKHQRLQGIGGQQSVMGPQETALIVAPCLDQDHAALEDVAAADFAVYALKEVEGAEAAHLVEGDIHDDVVHKALEKLHLGVDDLHIPDFARGVVLTGLALQQCGQLAGPGVLHGGACRRGMQLKGRQVYVTIREIGLQWHRPKRESIHRELWCKAAPHKGLHVLRHLLSPLLRALCWLYFVYELVHPVTQRFGGVLPRIRTLIPPYITGGLCPAVLGLCHGLHRCHSVHRWCCDVGGVLRPGKDHG
mmetsp:Transcript_20541/g.56962  ORF Transcript_20541/g.56962 Transcript_20541/m.56962 type:complete len:253 (+) Transcript_20541:334-1092(+)